MRKKVTLITGAGGEVGQALVRNLFEQGSDPLLTLDIRPLPEDMASYSRTSLAISLTKHCSLAW